MMDTYIYGYFHVRTVIPWHRGKVVVKWFKHKRNTKRNKENLIYKIKILPFGEIRLVRQNGWKQRFNLNVRDRK